MSPSLSKSTYLRGTQCRKSLYLNWFHPELKDPVSQMQRAIFSQGHEVGKLARQLFPGGTDAGIFVPDQYQKSIELTTQLIQNGADVIYEAGFATENLHCFVDILVRSGEKWNAFEVKSSTQVKQINLFDAAFQYYVMRTCGIEMEDISLIVLNTSYKRIGPLEINKLFKIQSVLKDVIKYQVRVEQDVCDFLKTLDLPEEPEQDIGPQCSDPYICDFQGHCWKHVPENSIFNISRLGADKKWELYRNGILKFEDIPPDFRLNYSQWQQVQSEIDGERYIDKNAIEKFVEELKFPLYFLDFESFQPAVPLYDNSRPYQQVVFQYSLHCLESDDGELQHTAFLAEADGNDPRLPFIRQLIEEIGETGDILVYNRTFEAGRLHEIAANFSDFQFRISNIVPRLKDLMLIFQNRSYYVPEMKGSYSIKQVLPALVPGFGYDGLEIADGGSASHAFMSMHSETDREKNLATRTNLLEYCKMDTLAMVEILKVLRSVK
jgi:hypothetical protein